MYKKDLYVLCGPPNSGKGTFCKKLLKKNNYLVRVNRDDVRYMLQNKGMLSKQLEGMITSINSKITNELLSHDYDVILDNTHCNIKYIKEIVEEYKEEEVNIYVVLFTHPLWKLLWRNIWRKLIKGIWIPPQVIKRMQSNQQSMLKELETIKEIKLITAKDLGHFYNLGVCQIFG